MNAINFHNTALHHAAQVGSADLIELLVEFGGDINASDNMNKRPLDYTSLESQARVSLLHYHSEFSSPCNLYTGIQLQLYNLQVTVYEHVTQFNIEGCSLHTFLSILDMCIAYTCE